MKKIILNSIFAICIVISLTSCEKWWKGGIGGGTYTDRLAFTEPIMESLDDKGGTPPGYGVLMVYFEELCIDKNEKVSVYVDNMCIGDISKAAGNRDPEFGEQSESCITCPLEIGNYSMSLKIGKDTYDVNPFVIRQNFCTRVPFKISCK